MALIPGGDSESFWAFSQVPVELPKSSHFLCTRVGEADPDELGTVGGTIDTLVDRE